MMNNNDWDLSAIVRSCSALAAGRKAIAGNTVEEEGFVHLDESPNDLSPFPNFPVLVDLRNEMDDPFDELSRIYKPFYGRVQLTAATPVAAAADPAIAASENKRRRTAVQEPRKAAEAPLVAAPAIPIKAAARQVAEPPQKKPNNSVGEGSEGRGGRKKQPRLVTRMDADLLLEDSWNWRKYGQKPIHGSMNPRSYYRCSSFKGCAARKQVEQCGDDPGVYIVTYIGDHTHRRIGAGRTAGDVSASPFPGDDAQNNENSKRVDNVVAMHELGSTGWASTGGRRRTLPKPVSTAGASA